MMGIIVIVFLLLCAFVLIKEIVTAPSGDEDENGFHEVKK